MIILYKKRLSKSFLNSIIVILSGLFILISSSLFIGNFDKTYLFYGLIAWLWLRLNEVIFNNLINLKINANLAFSISWFVPIIIICFLGLFHLNLPIFMLAIIGFIDFVFFLLFSVPIFFKQHWKYFFSFFLIGIIIIFLTIVHTDHQPWINELVYMGVINIDTLRDAAIFNSWSEYSSFSHGVHGLLFEPYHSLFVFFFDPFVNDTTDIFQVFVIFANMVIPGMVIYGCSKIIFLIGSNYVVKYWYFFLLFFILFFAEINLVMMQRSFLIATLILIGIIPLIFNIINNSQNSKIEVILLCLIVPLLIYARAFHGLFILGILLFFLLIKKIPYKPMILLSVVFSIFFTKYFYGQTNRVNDGILGDGYFIDFFIRSSSSALNNFIIPIILFLLIILFKKKVIIKYNNQSRNDIFIYFIVAICLLTLILLLRTNGFSDTFFQLAPIYWFTYFFLLTSIFNNLFLNSIKNIKKNLFDTKLLIIFILFIASINFFQKNLFKVVNHQSYLMQTIKSFRIINNELKNENIRNQLFIKKIDQSSCNNKPFISSCRLKLKIFGSEDLLKPSSESFLNKMIEQVKIFNKNQKGNTAVYISPYHEYWEFEKKSGFKGKFSIFFMATSKVPTLFGAHSNSNTSSLSIKTAQNNNGTLIPFKDIGGKKNLCSAAQAVYIDNIIVFQNLGSTEIISCK